MLGEEVGEIFVNFWGLVAADAADAADAANAANAANAAAVAVGNSSESIVGVDIGFSLIAYL